MLRQLVTFGKAKLDSLKLRCLSKTDQFRTHELGVYESMLELISDSLYDSYICFVHPRNLNVPFVRLLPRFYC